MVKTNEKQVKLTRREEDLLKIIRESGDLSYSQHISDVSGLSPSWTNRLVRNLLAKQVIAPVKKQKDQHIIRYAII